MKKTLTFEKDLTFDSRLGNINTISLEDDLKFIDSSNITGNFYVSGKYKMTEASTILEDFSYSIPIEISLMEEYDLNTTDIIIENFTYEIIDNSILRCKINLLVEGVEKIEIATEEEKEEEESRECDDDIVPDDLKELPVKKTDNKRTEIVDEKTEVIEEKEEKNETKNAIKVNSLFANLNDENDTFTTYSIYIMRENDSIEKVMDKYEVSKEELQNYNDLAKVELNSKIIIPRKVKND